MEMVQKHLNLPASEPEPQSPSTQESEREQHDERQSDAQSTTGEAEKDSNEAPQSDSEVISQAQQQEANSDLRKLEQVESARDPSYLLKAQMLLQAKERETPSSTGKNW